MESLTLIELTEEEVEKIMKDREEEKKKEVALEMLESIKVLVKSINDLGYHVRLPQTGGSYVRIHHPEVCAHKISISRW